MFLQFADKISSFSRQDIFEGAGCDSPPPSNGSEWKRFNPDEIFSGKCTKYKSLEENESLNAKETTMMSDMRFC
jgi:hypothetical protein